MSFGNDGLDLLKDMIDDDATIAAARLKPQFFTRSRKMGARDVIYYCLNKRGLCTSMEASTYFDKIGMDSSIATQSVFNQRMKMSASVFRNLNDAYLCAFYSGYPEETKLFKGYVLCGIDGSDLEVPNTKTCAEYYGIIGNANSGVARAGVSICYDLLNHYILDSSIGKPPASEIKMAIDHIVHIESIELQYKRIYIMDRNYVSLGFMQFFIGKEIKFLCRLKAGSHYKDEISRMASDDEILEIKHNKNRLKRSRFPNEELFQAAKKASFSRVRVVRFPLVTGEIEYLITNIEDFSYAEIVELYSRRWGIETAYFSLKQKLQIEKFTSSIPLLIEQDINSGVLAYNIIQSVKRDAEETIDQSQYKYEMKTNENMAIGYVKNALILILIEGDTKKRIQMYDAMVEKIARFKVPIRNGRSFPIRFKTDNNNSINKLKSY